MFWNKKKEKIDSEEFKSLKMQIEMIWLELDVLTMRYKRKVTKKQDEDLKTNDSMRKGGIIHEKDLKQHGIYR